MIGKSCKETARRLLSGEIALLARRSGDHIPEVADRGRLEPIGPAQVAPGSTNSPQVVQWDLWG